jgi:2-amino-4-hydroxy-6-hydroxymethyldihydropteridine diphosphokinase
MPEVYVSAGSNVDPAKRLRAAAAALESTYGAVRCSPVYRSAAVGAPAPDYLNLIFAFDTEHGADAVKAELVAIEAAAGRTRAQPRAALCALDLDLLVYGARVDARRHLPHADALRRAFVLAPLAALEPALVHPVSGERFAAAWARLAAAAPALEKLGELGSIEE